MSTISIIGSGGMAAAIGGLAAKAGHTVEVMSRDATKARALAEQIGAGATTGTFGTAPAGDIVILAVPYSAVLEVVTQYGEELAGKLLVDITNPVAPDFKSFVTPEDSFGAQEIAKAAVGGGLFVHRAVAEFGDNAVDFRGRQRIGADVAEGHGLPGLLQRLDRLLGAVAGGNSINDHFGASRWVVVVLTAVLTGPTA